MLLSAFFPLQSTAACSPKKRERERGRTSADGSILDIIFDPVLSLNRPPPGACELLLVWLRLMGWGHLSSFYPCVESSKNGQRLAAGFRSRHNLPPPRSTYRGKPSFRGLQFRKTTGPPRFSNPFAYLHWQKLWPASVRNYTPQGHGMTVTGQSPSGRLSLDSRGSRVSPNGHSANKAREGVHVHHHDSPKRSRATLFGFPSCWG